MNVPPSLHRLLTSGTFTPYLDYYDSAQTLDTGDAGGNATLSFGGSFYDD